MKIADKFIEKYGTVLTFNEHGNTKVIKGILQPFHYGYKSYFTPKRMPEGFLDNKHYRLITTPDLSGQIYADLLISSGGITYRVKNAETYSVKGEALYVQAVLTACAE